MTSGDGRQIVGEPTNQGASTMFKLEINTENDAFNGSMATELARILRKVANDVAQGIIPGESGENIFDINGNLVGFWHITEE